MSDVFDAVERLCVLMWNTPVLSSEQRSKLLRSPPAAQPGNPRTANDDADPHVEDIEHDLESQANIVSEMFTHYLETGLTPAPHYAWRVAVLLSKARQKRHEMAFLAAWCKHFGRDETGATFLRLVHRARRLGVFYGEPFSPAGPSHARAAELQPRRGAGGPRSVLVLLPLPSSSQQT